MINYCQNIKIKDKFDANSHKLVTFSDNTVLKVLSFKKNEEKKTKKCKIWW